MAPRKRDPGELGVLIEPHLTPEQKSHVQEGLRLFAEGSYWHAHEAWEHAWLGMPDGPEGDAEIILRGMIQLAAALHLQSIGRMDGAKSNFRKAAEKLALAPGQFMGVDIEALRKYIPAGLL